jgi:hypothetical protein
LVEPSARFEEFKIPLRESVRGFTEVSAIMGVPQWWPTGHRVGVVLAHGLSRDLSDPTLEHIQRELTERHCLTLRFNFPLGEAGKKRPDSPEILQRTFRAAINTMSRDPNATPAHLFIGGKGLGGQVAADLAGDRLRVDPVAGAVENLTTNARYTVSGLPNHLMAMVEAGGLMPYLKIRLGKN